MCNTLKEGVTEHHLTLWPRWWIFDEAGWNPENASFDDSMAIKSSSFLKKICVQNVLGFSWARNRSFDFTLRKLCVLFEQFLRKLKVCIYLEVMKAKFTPAKFRLNSIKNWMFARIWNSNTRFFIWALKVNSVHESTDESFSQFANVSSLQ